jgi:hypothetical protein
MGLLMTLLKTKLINFQFQKSRKGRRNAWIKMLEEYLMKSSKSSMMNQVLLAIS